MRLDLYQYPDGDTAERLRRIETMLGTILENQVEIMATIEELETVLADTDVRVANIAADVDKLLTMLAAVPVPGMTPEQQTALDAAVAHATAIRDSLAIVDAKA